MAPPLAPPPAPPIVGIDLGTTHTVVAECARDGSVRVVPLPQFVARGEIAAEPLLPSFLYAPLPEEAASDPWDDAPWVVGRHARQRGLEVPARLVSSAKSWLCHAAIDRTAAVLPWGAPDDVPRVSPVEASARLLTHVARAYDEEHPDSPLKTRRVVLTVPASFDQVARELTLRAAAQAGLSLRLLEEPQAAFYDYLRTRGPGELTELVEREGETWVLVCDIGGGTTDLTLLRATLNAERVLDVERIAVGKHLLLGGDNMDLALAHAVESRVVAPPERLDPLRFSQLVLACREAKERLLGDSPPEKAPVRVLSRGSGLVGGTLTADLLRSDVEQILLDGFFPEVPQDAAPSRAGAALVGFGLPYERDPAITKHLAAFFRRHAPRAGRSWALLLNGGIFRSARVADRLRAVVQSWTEGTAKLLAGTDPELAVARGAVAYGLSLDGLGIRIASGAARGYYVGLGGKEGPPGRALCVLPRGSREGERHHVTTRGLSVVVGLPVRFSLFASDEAMHEAGAVVEIESANLDPLPFMTTVLESPHAAGTTVPVELEGEITPIGTLEIACAETGGDGIRYQLAFELRAERRASDMPPESRRALARIDEGRLIVERVFGKGRTDVTPRAVKDLLRDLERVLGDRAAWPPDVNRALFDAITDDVKVRRRTADHERLFWMLAGFCLRPGYGYPGDDKRVGRVAQLFSEGLAFKDEHRGWQQFFIAWRRIAGGLRDKTQEQIRNLVDPFLAPDDAKLKKPKNFRPLATDEMLEMASMLERVPADRRAELGGWLLEQTWTNRDPRLWSAIGRLGARVPAYASAHHVVSPRTIERWLDHLLREKWEDMHTAPRAAFWLARSTGDRARDLPGALRETVAARLEAARARTDWVRALREVVPLADDDRAEVFGEALPVGLELARSEHLE